MPQAWGNIAVSSPGRTLEAVDEPLLTEKGESSSPTATKK
jgi:hypothetical protein